MSRKNRSLVWNYFVKNSDSTSVTCQVCKKSFKYFMNTSNLQTHLHTQHANVLISGVSFSESVDDSGQNSDSGSNVAASNSGNSGAAQSFGNGGSISSCNKSAASNSQCSDSLVCDYKTLVTDALEVGCEVAGPLEAREEVVYVLAENHSNDTSNLQLPITSLQVLSAAAVSVSPCVTDTPIGNNTVVHQWNSDTPQMQQTPKQCASQNVINTSAKITRTCAAKTPARSSIAKSRQWAQRCQPAEKVRRAPDTVRAQTLCSWATCRKELTCLQQDVVKKEHTAKMKQLQELHEYEVQIKKLTIEKLELDIQIKKNILKNCLPIKKGTKRGEQ